MSWYLQNFKWNNYEKKTNELIFGESDLTEEFDKEFDKESTIGSTIGSTIDSKLSDTTSNNKNNILHQISNNNLLSEQIIDLENSIKLLDVRRLCILKKLEDIDKEYIEIKNKNNQISNIFINYHKYFRYEEQFLDDKFLYLTIGLGYLGCGIVGIGYIIVKKIFFSK
jgi:hypothetical protein